MDNNNKKTSLSFEAIAKVLAGVLLMVLGSALLLTFMPNILPAAASAEAQNVDSLFTILLFLGGIVFFLIQGLLVVSIIAFRAKPGDDTDGPSNHGNMTLEIVWTIIPSVVVVFLAIISFSVWNTNTTPKEDENMVNGAPIEYNVTGARYAWTHEYVTNTMDDEGNPVVINTGNVLHTYLGQNVHLTMQTQDVIHSYWVPAMRVKQDLLPGNPETGGRPTELRFTPVRVEGETYPAEYPIVCAELCGDGHGRMRGVVVVYETEEQYLNMFYEPAVDVILNPPADPVLRGESTIQEYACSGCHVLDPLGWVGVTGPSLNAIADRAGERVSGQTAEEYIANSIWNPGDYLAPGYQNLMPAHGPGTAYDMTPEQLYSIVAYLCTQGEDSDCDNENNTEAIPAAIESLFGVRVDTTFGIVADAEPVATDEMATDADAEEAPAEESGD
jgi:cytochrome c oxidase subunit 2